MGRAQADRTEKTKKKESLKRFYTSPRERPAFGGLSRLNKEAKQRHPTLKRTEVEEWARGVDAYTLHRPAKKKFKRRKTIVSGPGVQLQADLLDVGSGASVNDGVRYLLTIVDCFSRKAWAVPLKTKKGEEVASALRSAVGGLGYKRLQTDKGREFLNANVSTLLEREGIDGFTTENDDIKAAIVERFNRTLKKKIYAYLTHTRSGRYVDVLQDFVNAYNKTPTRGTRLAPDAVNTRNTEEAYNRLYEDRETKSTASTPLAPGDHVRMSVHRGAFARGYTANWSREIFVVSRTRDWTRLVVYEIKDLAGEDVDGTFYAQELQKVEPPTEFVVEEVRRTRGKGARKELYIKWLGYPESFNTWEPADNIV